jgi:hypothetical protein
MNNNKNLTMDTLIKELYDSLCSLDSDEDLKIEHKAIKSKYLAAGYTKDDLNFAWKTAKEMD